MTQLGTLVTMPGNTVISTSTAISPYEDRGYRLLPLDRIAVA
ncbi:MAG: hypothetical protein ACKOWC_12570 [Limnohabitans sp.]